MLESLSSFIYTYSLRYYILFITYYYQKLSEKICQKCIVLRQTRNPRKAQRQSIRIKNVTPMHILACVILAHAPLDKLFSRCVTRCRDVGEEASCYITSFVCTTLFSSIPIFSTRTRNMQTRHDDNL